MPVGSLPATSAARCPRAHDRNSSAEPVRKVPVTDVDPYRLPTTVTPSRYELRLEPDLEGASFTGTVAIAVDRSEEHTSELQSRLHLVCRLLLEKKKKKRTKHRNHLITLHNNISNSYP